MEGIRQLKAEIFRALSHPTRLAILETLGAGELSVTAIADRLQGEQANISQHLAVLRARHLLVPRKSANQVFYSVRDPRLLEVLRTMRTYCRAHLSEDQLLLADLKSEMKGR